MYLGYSSYFLLVAVVVVYYFFGRYDENQYFARMMKLVGHKQTYLYELDGYDHGDMIGPGLPVVLKHIRKMTAKQGE